MRQRIIAWTLALGLLLSALPMFGKTQVVHAAGTTYYVATADNGGNDSNPGTQDQPFLTIAHAADMTNPGDTVIVGDGTYDATKVNAKNLVFIGHSGAPGNYIVFKSQHPYGAKLVARAGLTDAILIWQANYIEINGFDITTAGAVGDCIYVEGSFIRIIGNHTHDCAGHGIGTQRGDYWWVEGNTVNNNTATAPYDTSGISLFEARAADDSPGFHNVVRNNITFSNLAINCGTCKHTDGNGIIIDTFHNEVDQPQGNGINYPYQTLVENNLAYDNGGGGIHVYRSDHVTVRNNTVYGSYKDPLDTTTWLGELTNIQGSDNHWYNNIAVVNPALNRKNVAIVDGALRGYTNTGVTWTSNLTFSGTPGDPSLNISRSQSVVTPDNGNLLGVDPQAVALGVTPDANFHLQPSSPAIGAGTTAFGVPGNDLDGKPRLPSIVDMGCYETHQA